MKKIIALLVFTCSILNVHAQFTQHINFDDSSYKKFVYRDTISNPNCIWQVGTPHKTVFNFSNHNVIITDTLNPIPVNDTSVFYIKHPHPNIFNTTYFTFTFFFRINGDSNDYGIVEISPDLGHHWINLLTDTNYNIMWTWQPKPTLRGNCTCTSFMGFGVDLTTWANASSGYPVLWDSDTTLFRITYITDSINNIRDGLVINDIDIEDLYFQDIQDIQQNDLITIAPNPVKDELHFIRKKISQNETLTILNLMGEIVYQNTNFTQSSINTRQLPSGIYLLRYANKESSTQLRFLKE